MFGKRKIATLVAEFLGTGALTLLILTVQRSTIGVPFFVAIAAGLTVTMMVFAVGGISGGYFNPALTLGFWAARKLETITAAMYIVVQVLGAWAAYGLYTYFVNSSLQVVGGNYSGRIMVAEAVGTALFSMGVAAAVYQGFSRAVTASFAGLSLMLGALAASSAAIGLLNPAVALGIRAWVPFGDDVAGWGTYVLGPVVGSVVGVSLYALLFADSDLTAQVEGKPATAAAVVAAKKGAAKPKRAAASTTTKKKTTTRRKK